MKIRKSGIFKTIDSKDFGVYQKQGWEKVIIESLPKLEEVEKMEVIDEPTPVIEAGKGVLEDELVDAPVDEVVDEMPKSKKNRRK